MDKTRLAALALLSILLVAGSSGCSIKFHGDETNDPVTEAVAVIDKGIEDINTGSADWQTVIQQVSKDLPEGISENIRVDAQNLADRSVARSGIEFRADIDFLNRRAIQNLENLKAELLGKKPTVLPPALCHVVPVSVDLKTSPNGWSTLSYIGYDLDHRDSNGNLFKIFAVNDQGAKIPFPEERIGRTTHYEVTVNMGGLEKWLYEEKIRKLAFDWNDSNFDQGEIVIIPWEPETETVVVPSSSTTYTPLHNGGDKDFNTNDGNPMHVNLLGILNNDGQSISSQIYMKAREHDDDYTQVESWSPASVIYKAPNGWEIIDFQPSAVSNAEGDITEHGKIDYSRPAGEVISTFQVWGDRDGDEAGTYTHVVADWRELHVTIKQINPDWA